MIRRIQALRALVFIASTAFLAQGCAFYVVDTREEVQERNPTILERDVTYTPTGVSLDRDTISVALDRSCRDLREVDLTTVHIERREYETFWAWMGLTSGSLFGFMIAGSLAFIGAAESSGLQCDSTEEFFYDPDACAAGDDLQDAAAGLAIATAVLTAAGIGTLIYFELETPEAEFVVDSQRQKREEVYACPGEFPKGNAQLMAQELGESYFGQSDGSGRVLIDVANAPVDFWLSNTPLQLQLPNELDWVEVALPDAVRRAGLERTGEALLRVALTLDDAAGNGDGVLDAGESAQVRVEITNDGESTARDLSIDLTADNDAGLDIETPVKLTTVGAGQTLVGTVDISATEAIESRTVTIEGIVSSEGTTVGSDRLRLEVLATTNAQRVYVYYEPDKKYGGQLEAGTTRIQSVLTDTRKYQFVSDEDTRDRIQKVVEKGGGNPDARRKTALEAARAEDITRVIQLSVTPISGDQAQIVFSVYNTSTGDRIFLKDAPVDLSDAFQTLDVFETLADAFLAWERK